MLAKSFETDQSTIRAKGLDGHGDRRCFIWEKVVEREESFCHITATIKVAGQLGADPFRLCMNYFFQY